MPTTAVTTRRKEPQSSKDGRPPASSGKVGINDLIEVLQDYLDPKEVNAVYKAYLFGADAHDGQRRRIGAAYISHPVSVALILAGMRLDSSSISAAILHDVIEDTPTLREQLAESFGEDVALLVDGVSKIDQIEF